MAYRGGDLDLRTPRTWSATAPEPSPPPAPVYERARGAYTPGPIWVDEVVLACVNHAYDVALAHRAAEVRLEHLLHALTRIDTAAEVVEVRGIRVAALRRESATLIASELPANLPPGEAGPRHSEELEHVLRAASLIASRRNAPATVEDLLHVMLDVEPDLPGLGLLARIDPRFQNSNGAYSRPSRPAYNNNYYYAPTSEPSSNSNQPPREIPRPPRSDVSASVGGAQNGRLDALEHMLRAFSADFGNDRKSLGGVLADLQRDVTNLRAAPLDVGPIADRIATIERSITAGFEQFSLAIASIENDIRARGQDLTPVANRLEIIEEAVLSRDHEKAIRELSERLDRLETTLAGERTRAAETGAVLRGEIGQLAQAIDTHRSEIANSVLPITDRMAEFRSTVEAHQSEAGETMRALAARVAGIEQKIAEGHTAAREDLAEVSDAIVKLNANQHTLAGNIEQTRNDTRDGLAAIRDDLRVTSTGLTGAFDALGPRVSLIEGETQRIGGTVDGLSGTVENMYRMTIERYYRRNRFWYWLFGTDDWVAASWPSQSQRIADDLKAVKVNHQR
jgi:predicted  nucleic acid-binding Zn-ribbon protein